MYNSHSCGNTGVDGRVDWVEDCISGKKHRKIVWFSLISSYCFDRNCQMFPLQIAILITGFVTLLLSFSIAIRLRNRKTIPISLSRFYLCPAIGLGITINSILYIIISTPYLTTAMFLEKIFFTFDYIFWGYFFYDLNRKSKSLRLLVLLIWAITLVVVITVNAYERHTFVSLAVSNLSKCIFCLVYLYRLINTLTTVILKEEPVFWIIVGLFLYTAITLPIYVTTTHLSNEMQKIKLALFHMTNITIIIMHFFFIKGYLCSLRRIRV